jgi:glycine betaine transporter
MLASRGALEPARAVVAIMGCLMGAIACALLLVGGLSALQQGAVLASVPFTFVIVGLAYSLTKALREERVPAKVPLVGQPATKLMPETPKGPS